MENDMMNSMTQTAPHAVQIVQALPNPYNEKDHGKNWHASAHAWDECAISVIRALRATKVSAEQESAAPVADQNSDIIEAANEWAETYYRNADTFTLRDLGIVQAAWTEASSRAALPSSARHGQVPSSEVACDSALRAEPAGQHEITRLDILSLIHQQCHRVYASAIDREDIDTKYMQEIDDALRSFAASSADAIPHSPDWLAYHSALSQCAELLDNMAEGDPITDTPKFLAAKLAEQASAAPVAVKTWQERAKDDGWASVPPPASARYMEAEIADWRALAAQPAVAPSIDTAEQVINKFEAIIAEDPAAYNRVGECVYQVTRAEVTAFAAWASRRAASPAGMDMRMAVEVAGMAAASILHSHKVDHLKDDDGEPRRLGDLLADPAEAAPVAIGNAEVDRIVAAISAEFEAIAEAHRPQEGAA